MDADINWVCLLGAHVVFAIASNFVVVALELSLESLNWCFDIRRFVHWRFLGGLRCSSDAC